MQATSTAETYILNNVGLQKDLCEVATFNTSNALPTLNRNVNNALTSPTTLCKKSETVHNVSKDAEPLKVSNNIIDMRLILTFIKD